MKKIFVFVIFVLVLTDANSQLTFPGTTLTSSTSLIIKDPIIKDPIIKEPVIWEPPIIIVPPIIIIPPILLTTYEKRPLAADAIAFADFNSNDTVDYVRTDSMNYEVILEIKYDSVSIEDNIYNSDTSSIPVHTSDTATVTLKSVQLKSLSVSSLLTIDKTATLYDPKYLGDFYTINKLNLIDGSFIFRDPIDDDDEDNRTYIPNGAISVGDFNNDNLPDFLVSGAVYIKNMETDKYGIFNKAMVWYNLDTAFMIMWSLTEPIENGEVWDVNNVEDYNHDGLQDINIGGYIYLNDGLSFNNTLKHIDEVPHIYNYQGEKVYLDYDNDGAMDYHYKDTLYINNSTSVNAKPEPPTNLRHYINSDTIIFCWSPGSDTESSQSNLTYNIWVGTTGNGTQIISPLADLTTGKRKLYRIGNAGTDTCYRLVLKDAITATFYWSVQTIDGNYEGSEFPEKQTLQYSIITPYLTNHMIGSIDGRMLNGTTDLFDADNDNDLDLLTTGNFFTLKAGHLDGYGGLLRLYSNQNDYEMLDELTNIDWNSKTSRYEGFTDSKSEVLDIDKDGYIDFVMMGNKQDMTNTLTPVENPVLSLYINTGSSVFTETFLDSLAFGDVACGDLDNDGDDDIAACGMLSGKPTTIIYVNHDGKFKKMEILEGLAYGNVVLADYDNDYDLDILINGFDGDAKYMYLYQNNGKMQFIERSKLNGFTGGDMVACDLNNDKFVDFVITGDYSKSKRAYVLRNRAGRDFVMLYYSTTGLLGVGENDFDVEYNGLSYPIQGRSSIEYGDYDNDGLMDLMFTGEGMKRSAFLYRNLGEFRFETIDFFFDRVEASSVDMGDIDNDGDIDFYIQGYNGTVENCCLNREMYINNRNITSSIDTVKNLSAEMVDLDMILSWEDLYDGDENSLAYSYNIRIGTQKDLSDVISPMSDLITGYRRITKTGNVQMNNSWRVDLAPGTYYWSVQAIDGSFKGGPWSVTDSFVVTTINPEIASENVCLGMETHFYDQSVSSPAIIKWLWDFGDGNTSDEKNPVHIFSGPGKHFIHVWLYNAVDSAEVFDTVEVYYVPNANFTVSPICEGEMALMNNLSDTSMVNVQEWIWTFRNDYKVHNRSDVEVEYTTSDFAYLEIITKQGCVDIDSQWVEVVEYPDGVLLGDDDPICETEETVLSVNSYSSKYKYVWYKNASPIANSRKYELTVGGSTLGKSSYHYVATNTVANCVTKSNTKSVTVIEQPTKPLLDFTDELVSLCPDQYFGFSIQNYNKNYDYRFLYNGKSEQKIESSELYRHFIPGEYSVVASVGQCLNNSSAFEIEYKDAFEKPELYANDGPDVYYISCSIDDADIYEWYYNGNKLDKATKFYYLAGSNLGSYYVRVKDVDMDCYTKSDVISIPNLTTDIEIGQIDSDGVMIYPVPAIQYFNIKIENGYQGQVFFELCDIAGKVLIKEEFTKDSESLEKTVDLLDLTGGYYFVNLHFDNKVISRKLTIQ